MYANEKFCLLLPAAEPEGEDLEDQAGGGGGGAAAVWRLLQAAPGDSHQSQPEGGGAGGDQEETQGAGDYGKWRQKYFEKSKLYKTEQGGEITCKIC